MIYLKTFESFGVNETLGDMMMLPIDITGPGISKAYKEIYDDLKSAIGTKFSKFTEELEKATNAVIDEVPSNQLLDNIKKFFGKDLNTISEQDIKTSLSKKLNESSSWWFSGEEYDKSDPYTTTKGEDEHTFTPIEEIKGGILQKISSVLQTILGINLLSFGFFGTILASILGGALTFGMSFVLSIVGFIVIHIIRKLLAM